MQFEHVTMSFSVSYVSQGDELHSSSLIAYQGFDIGQDHELS